jgi:undecaprenyl-diphosphatase
MHLISPLDALILGMVEGLTEYLPVSSTGHLILASHWLGLPASEGIDAFTIVIQSGAILAVAGIYWPKIAMMMRGLLGRDPAGVRLAAHLLVAFAPAAVIGLAAEGWIKARLFGQWPVVAALAAGGAAMIAVERWRRFRAGGDAVRAGRDLAAMTWRAALLIGFAQCLAMWPGTSRSMVTIVAALLLGFQPRAAAEFSFLLALPTLGGATAHDALRHGGAIVEASGLGGLAVGFIVSCAVAFLAVEGFLAFLRRHGMEAFGWYRIALAVVVVLVSPSI